MIIEILRSFLPKEFTAAADILLQIPEYWDPGEQGDSKAAFAAWPLIDYSAHYGLKHAEKSLDVLERLTPLFSAEFAIRPFIEHHFNLTYKKLHQWCDHPDHHVRRLASEGSRPRLPWGKYLQQFIQDPVPLLPILENLKLDSSSYVRRSVANNLNDIGKDHPELIIETCKNWSIDADTNLQRVISHALRSLIKQGRPEVFPILGYTNSPDVRVENLRLESNKINVGESLEFSFVITAGGGNVQSLVTDYAINFARKSGTWGRKVFKLKNLTLEPGATKHISKSHSFKRVTTRQFYAGQHKLEILTNGIVSNEILFELEENVRNELQ